VDYRHAKRSLDECVQLHGGYGYMEEFWSADVCPTAAVQLHLLAGPTKSEEVISRGLQDESIKSPTCVQRGIGNLHQLTGGLQSAAARAITCGSIVYQMRRAWSTVRALAERPATWF
jgi:hypothetical protein